MSKIEGGYYIKARKIQDSAIAKSPPHVREIWDLLLKDANHKDNKCYGTTIRRGELFTDYNEIIEELSWREGFVKKSYKKHHVDYAMRWLRQELMITTQKTTRGLLITICNYDYYQNPTNYEKDFDYDTITTRLRQGTDTIHKNVKNEKKEETYTSAPEKIFATIMGLGTMEISILNNCGGWQIKHLCEFISKSDKEFEIMAMNKPELRNVENFQALLQDFVNRIQEGDEYKETGALKRHFKNWVNDKNGTLELYLKGLKNKNSTTKITANNFI